MTKVVYKRYIFLATFILVIFSGLFYFLFNDGKYSSSNIVNSLSLLKLPFTGFATGSDEIDLPKSEAEIAFEQSAISDTGINPNQEKLKEIKGVSKNHIAVKIQNNENNELWVFDVEKKKKVRIGFNESEPSNDFSIGMKDEFIFWISKDLTKLFIFSTKTKETKQIDLKTYNLGSRPQLTIEGISWKVIIGAQEFYFYREETGEVFSDDNGLVKEEFRKSEDLDSFLDNDSLVNLKLQLEG